MSHLWNTTRLLDFVDNPVPIADGLQSHRCSFGELREVVFNGLVFMIDPDLLAELSLIIQDSEQ